MKEKKGILKSLSFYFLSLIIFGLVISIGIGCGGNGNNDESIGDDIPQILQGQFIDAPVQGINFLSGSQSGVTGANGEFNYEVGKKIKFSIGDIQLGIETIAKKIITPIDLVENGTLENTTVLNIARFIQSLDSDPSDNVITIPTSIRENAVNQSLVFSNNTTFENNANNLLTDLTNNNDDYQSPVTLVDSVSAQTHLQGSIFVGFWQGSGTFVAEDETKTEDGTLNLSFNGDNLAGAFMTETEPLEPPFSISGTVNNGIFTFDVPNSDPSNPDCANWDVDATATLDAGLTTMSLEFSGIFCGLGGGKQGTSSASLTKSDHPTGLLSYSGEWNETDGDEGTFIMKFIQTDISFIGTYDVVKNTYEGGSYSYTISGTRNGNSYEGIDSRGRTFSFEVNNNTLSGSYHDPDGGETGQLN